jgi:nitrite reductase/ring-hydroxylating ferredoxin subunit
LEDSAVRCPWHGSCFSLEDGRVLEGPSVHAQPVLEVRVRDGQIEVRRSDR